MQWEAECVASNIPHETKKPYWRIQYGDGLEMTIGFNEVVELAESMGRSLTLPVKAVLEESIKEEEKVVL